jgi:hypothetical protein
MVEQRVFFFVTRECDRTAMESTRKIHISQGPWNDTRGDGGTRLNMMKHESLIYIVSTIVVTAFLFGGNTVVGSVPDPIDPYADKVIWAYTPYTYCDQMNPLDALGPSDVMPFDICGYPGFIILEFTDVCLVDGPGDRYLRVSWVHHSGVHGRVPR